MTEVTKEECFENSQKVMLMLNDHEHEIGSLKHRMREQESLTGCINKLATNMECMLKEQIAQGKRIEELEREPAENWKVLIQALITGAVGVFIGYFM